MSVDELATFSSLVAERTSAVKAGLDARAVYIPGGPITSCPKGILAKRVGGGCSGRDSLLSLSSQTTSSSSPSVESELTSLSTHHHRQDHVPNLSSITEAYTNALCMVRPASHRLSKLAQPKFGYGESRTVLSPQDVGSLSPTQQQPPALATCLARPTHARPAPAAL
jgi:hypothetical protein